MASGNHQRGEAFAVLIGIRAVQKQQLTTRLWPPWAASISAVLPPLLCRLISAPCCSSSSTARSGEQAG